MGDFKLNIAHMSCAIRRFWQRDRTDKPAHSYAVRQFAHVSALAPLDIISKAERAKMEQVASTDDGGTCVMRKHPMERCPSGGTGDLFGLYP
jgi:hypothetical protein